MNSSQQQTSVPLVNLTIDERPITVPKGTNIIEAAKKLGVHIPHYCYHSKLSVAGNCRMCLVEVGMQKKGPEQKPIFKPDGTPEISWFGRPQIGCATQVSEGMFVRTKSKMVEQCRKSVMEFLLINHPLDCPICDQAGECKLQEYSVEYGSAGSRFVEQKVKKPKKVELGPRVTLDDERCILCSRCIRFCQEVAKDDVLGFTHRGSHTSLSCYPGKKLENNYSLNTVDLCPVGALTSNDFRFKMRVWFLKETKSICTSCSTGCNITAGSREGVVYRTTPRRNDAVNSSWMCDGGRLNYKWINDERRLTSPMKKHEKIDWAVVLPQIRELLSESGRKNELAIVASARASTEELFLVRQMADLYGARAVDVVTRTGEHDNILLSADKNPNSGGAKLHGLVTGKIDEIKNDIENGRIKTLFVQGENLEKAGFGDKLLKKLETLIVMDVLPSSTTEEAAYLLPGATPLEKCGTFINGKGRIQRFHSAFPCKGHSRQDWEILKELLPEPEHPTYHSFEAVFETMINKTPALAGITWQGIGDEGVWVESLAERQ